jgi:dihydropteroate synthase
VIRALAAEGVAVSVDTMRAEVAEAAVEAGAVLVNDVSGGLADPEMPRVVAATGVPYVVMHWRGHSSDMDSRAVYADVVTEVAEELRKRVDLVRAEGVLEEQIVLDPGLGFSKNAEHNWAVLAGIGRLRELGRPLIIGASRKRFLGRLLAGAEGTPRPFDESDDATVAVTALAAHAGAWCVRVHRVRPNADAVRVAAAWKAAGQAPGRAAGSPAGETPGRAVE